MTGRPVRVRNLDNVLDEIEMLQTKYDIHEFLIMDDSLTLNQRHLQNFCKEIIKRIIDEAGYTVEYAFSMPADFNLVALACPVTKFFPLQDVSQANFSSYKETIFKSVYLKWNFKAKFW